MKKKTVLVAIAALGLTACQPQQNFWYNDYPKERQVKVGDATRELCDADPYAPECPYKPAADVVVCEVEPELCPTVEPYPNPDPILFPV